MYSGGRSIGKQRRSRGDSLILDCEYSRIKARSNQCDKRYKLMTSVADQRRELLAALFVLVALLVFAQANRYSRDKGGSTVWYDRLGNRRGSFSLSDSCRDGCHMIVGSKPGASVPGWSGDPTKSPG